MAHRRFHPAFGRVNQQVDFRVVLQRLRNGANQQQVGVFVLNLAAVVGHAQVNGRQAGLRANAAGRLQQRGNLALGRRFGHHDQGIGEIGHPAVREARVSKYAQIRHRHKVIVLREIDGRVVAYHHVVLYRLEGNTVIDRTARHRVHILEVEAQLIHGAEAQCRDRHFRFAVQQPLKHRQA